MNILVVSATKTEIAGLLSSAEFSPQIVPAHTIEQAPHGTTMRLDVLITGVGAPACMYLLTKQLKEKKYDLIIQAGIAGTFRNAYAPGDVVVVAHDVFADLGILEKDELFTLFDKGFADASVMPYTNGRLKNPAALKYGLPAVSAITINTVTDNYAQTEIYKRKFEPDIESMEGAAFHYVCIAERVAFIQLRSISNFVGERIKTNWKMKESVENLNAQLQKMIKTFSTNSSL